MDIRFCDRCDSSIPTGDLDQGRAVRKSGRLLCAKCRGQVRTELALRISLTALCLLVVASAGALAAVLVLSPRVEMLETKVHALGRGLETATAGDPGHGDELGAMRRLIRQQKERIDALTGALNDRFGKIQTAMATWPEQAEDLALAIGELKAHLAALSQDPVPKPVTDLELLLGLVTDADSGARITALIKLAAFDDPRVVLRAKVALEDPDPRVRFQAAVLVGEKKGLSAVPKLLELLADDSELVRHAAHRALLEISGERIRFEPTQTPEVRAEGEKAWREWWKSQQSD